jgi:hypothetical protein
MSPFGNDLSFYMAFLHQAVIAARIRFSMSIDSLSGLPRLALRFSAGELAPAEYAARYVLQWQLARHGSRLAQRRSRRDAKPDGIAWLATLDALAPEAAVPHLIGLLENYDLRGVRRRVNVALAQWLRGRWPLTLLERIPDTREVLYMQIAGTRPVTVIADYPRLLEPVEEKADGFAFICHDLEHAWQFFHDPERHAAQRRFAEELAQAIDQGVFAPYTADADFARKFDYLAADMNTHVAHSLQYLRAILLEFHLRAEDKAPTDRLSHEARDRLQYCLAGFSGTELLRGAA